MGGAVPPLALYFFLMCTRINLRLSLPNVISGIIGKIGVACRTHVECEDLMWIELAKDRSH